MSNHLYLIASAKNENLSDRLRDFKKYTSKQIIETIINNKQKSRKDCLPARRRRSYGAGTRQAGMLRIFKEEGSKNSRNKSYQFWRQDNQPQELYSPKFVFQKINYMHYNPVIAGIVERPEHYLYSSARDYLGKTGLIEITLLDPLCL